MQLAPRYCSTPPRLVADINCQIGSKIRAQLARAGSNRAEIERALLECNPAERQSVAFLVLYMPEADLQNLSAEYIKLNCALAHSVRCHCCT